jgi:signal transduction histidine kinase
VLLADDALKFATVDAGKLKLSLAQYALEDILETVRHTLGPRAVEKRLGLEISAPQALPTGIGDGGKITEALINLVDNAIKFTDAGEVCVQAHAADEQFVVSVRDTGPGISEADREKIFDEFYQTRSSTMRKESGTGLGLAIARYYVEAHGGRIRVESCQGQGSTFRVEFPIRFNGRVEGS